MNTNCGIYMIMNLVNGKFYIGSSYNINNRWNKHRHAAYGYIWKYKNNINN